MFRGDSSASLEALCIPLRPTPNLMVHWRAVWSNHLCIPRESEGAGSRGIHPSSGCSGRSWPAALIRGELKESGICPLGLMRRLLQKVVEEGVQ